MAEAVGMPFVQADMCGHKESLGSGVTGVRGYICCHLASTTWRSASSFYSILVHCNKSVGSVSGKMYLLVLKCAKLFNCLIVAFSYQVFF